MHFTWVQNGGRTVLMLTCNQKEIFGIKKEEKTLHVRKLCFFFKHEDDENS